LLKLYELAGAEDDRLFSPFCWRIRLALAHKGLVAETIPWRFTEKDRIAPTGQGRVPVLVDGDRWIADSWVIAEYLEAQYPDRPSLFGGASGHALSRLYNEFVTEAVQFPILWMIIRDIWSHLHPRDQAYFRNSREQRLGMSLEEAVADRDLRVKTYRRSLDPLRRVVEAQRFFGGDAPLYADYILFGAFMTARAMSPFSLLEADDPIASWRERMLDLYQGLARNARLCS